MRQVETLPQSIAELKKIVLKPRLDQSDIQLIEKEIKPRLFSRLGFKTKLENIRLLCSEMYFEPYLIIGGKYSLDYCKKHLFKVNVNKGTKKIFIAGQEYRVDESNSKAVNNVIKIPGEEYAHYEKQTYLILDRMKREIPPEKLPFAPFDFQQENSEQTAYFRRIDIPSQIQIEILKTKIARRPSDSAEIIKEIFDITDRTVIYYPIYQLTFENIKAKSDVTIIIDGITGEVTKNEGKKLKVEKIAKLCEKSNAIPPQARVYEEIQENTELKIDTTNIRTKTKETPSKERPIHSIQHAYREIVDGDVEISSGTTINKNLVVNGSLSIGDNCVVHGRLEASNDITVGADTIIDGDLVSGGNVFLGSRSLVAGSVEAAGLFEIEENAIIEGGSVQASIQSID